jgi:hypothetical protein
VIADLARRRRLVLNSERQLYDARPGDVFGIPFHGGNYQVGQVIDDYKGALYVVVFDSTVTTTSPGLEAARAALDTPPRLARMTFDSRFRPGMWEIFGSATPDRRRFLPAYSVKTPGQQGVEVTSFDGSARTTVTSDLADAVPPLVIDSPMILEKFVRALHGEEPWLPFMDDLIYRETPTSAELFD